MAHAGPFQRASITAALAWLTFQALRRNVVAAHAPKHGRTARATALNDKNKSNFRHRRGRRDNPE